MKLKHMASLIDKLKEIQKTIRNHWIRMSRRERWVNAQSTESSYWKIWKSWEIRYGENFRKAVNRYWITYLRLITSYIYKIQYVLEVGGGPHGLIYYLGRITPKNKLLVAVDPLMDQYWTDFDLRPEVKHIKAVGEQLPFKSRAFDVVISTNVLDHVIEPRIFIGEINRVLRQGAILVLSVKTYGPLMAIRKKIREKAGRGETPHPHIFTLSEVLTMMHNAGFRMEHATYKASTLGDFVGRSLRIIPQDRPNINPLSIDYLVPLVIDRKLGYEPQVVLFILSKLEETASTR